MTTPFVNEYGDWFAFDRVESIQKLRRNHKDIADSVLKLNSIEKDKYLLSKSI